MNIIFEAVLVIAGIVAVNFVVLGLIVVGVAYA